MNLIKQAGQALATFAPTIATALGGPLAGVAVSSIEKAFGIDSSSDPQAKQAAIEQGLMSATPDQIIALQKAEIEFKEQMSKFGLDEKKLVYDDVANARSREIAVKDWTPRILAYAVVGLTVMIEGALLIYGQPKNVDGVVLGRILGTWDAAVMLVLTYYFGTTAGSREKDATIADMAKQT